MSRLSLSIFIVTLLCLGMFSIVGTRPSLVTQSIKQSHSMSSVHQASSVSLPIVGVFSSTYSSSNITDASLTAGSKFAVQINVTNAPTFNGYEFALFYDPTYLQVTSWDIKSGLFPNPFSPISFNGTGVLALTVVNLGSQVSAGFGQLVNVTFVVVKSGGVSPLTLAAGTADPSSAAGLAGGSSPNAPSGTADWTRIVSGSNPIAVTTQDGYYKNTPSAGPVASFTFSPQAPVQGDMVTFNASKSFDPDSLSPQNHGIFEYLWDFGDRSNATTFTPITTHSFAPVSVVSNGFFGNFSVRLTVIDIDNGFQGMTTVLFTITPQAVHDIAVNLFPSSNPVSQGQTIRFEVQVRDVGTSTETYDLTLTYSPGNITIGHLAGQTITSGATNTVQFSLNTTSLSPGVYIFVATATDPLDTNPSNNKATAIIQVEAADEPPIAFFTVNPPNPIVGTNVGFDGSGSNDPDGSIVQWNWNFGDGNSIATTGSFFSHTYSLPGNYTVSLMVIDSSGLTASTSMPLNVLSRPSHDVVLVFVQVFPQVAVSGQTVDFEAEIGNLGMDSSNVNVTFYYNGNVAVSQNGIFIPGGAFTSVNVPWDTTGIPPGNYTISATAFLAGDPTPGDNSVTDGQLQLRPPPVITLTPTSGPVGTLVTLHATNFLVGQFTQELEITFDNQLVGFFFPQNSTFDFSFDVPVAQIGTHTIHALQIFPESLDIKTTFIVTPTQGQIAIGLSVGTIYFPGDTATIFITTSINGQLTSAQTLQVVLIRLGAGNITLSVTSISPGVYKATYTIPSTGSVIGTYAIIVKAHITGSTDSAALTSFEVKQTWLASNSKNITTGVAIAGLVGLVGFAWQRGYFRKKDEDPAQF